ncbi:MAG: hypothetical protein ABJA67_15445 [Chthonomonadales bacterium]
MRINHSIRLVLAGTALLGFGLSGRTVVAQTPPTPKTTQDSLEALKKLLESNPELAKQLRALLDQLDKGKGQTPVEKPNDEPPIPDVVIPGDNKAAKPVTPSTAPTAGTARASLTPDISVIGNNSGRYISVNGDPDRNRLQLGEVEVGLQQAIYPGVRFDAFLIADSTNGFIARFEELYASISKVGSLPFGAYIGKERLTFGKLNHIHPHSRNFVDQPAPLAYLLDPDSLNGDGASINYLLPIPGLFANVELGMWNLQPADTSGLPRFGGSQKYPVGAGINGNFTSGRLWTSKQLGTATELELGASHGFGRSDIGGDNVRLSGIDLTMRNFPGTFKRIMLQAEAIWHTRQDKLTGTGSHTRSGQYVFANYKPDQYFDYGFRFDNSSLPWPLAGRETSFSLIWSDHLTETTTLRLQYKFGNRSSDLLLPSARKFSELYLQFVWGGGSHSHSLQ